MPDHAGQAKARRFLELHVPGRPLLLPNPWDQGSARLLAWLGFEALATTSSGFAATLGRLDGSVTREDAVAHAATIVAATELPVSVLESTAVGGSRLREVQGILSELGARRTATGIVITLPEVVLFDFDEAEIKRGVKELAAVLTTIRNSWGNAASAITTPGPEG